MPMTHTFSTSYQGGSGLALVANIVFTGTSEENVNTTAANGWVNHPISSYEFDWLNLQSIFILATQDLTLEFTSAGTSSLIIELTANAPYCWYAELGSSPFDNDVTGLLVTNASGADADLNIRTLLS